MSKERTTQILLVIVAILLLANLAQPLLKPVTAFAQDEDPPGDVQMTGTGNNIWILKGNQLYYIKWEHQFESFRVYGPEELER